MKFNVGSKKMVQVILGLYLALNVGSLHAEESKEKKDLAVLIHENPAKVLEIIQALQDQLKDVEVKTLNRVAMVADLKKTEQELARQKTFAQAQNVGKDISSLLAGAGVLAAGINGLSTVINAFSAFPQGADLKKSARMTVVSGLIAVGGGVGYKVFNDRAAEAQLDVQKMEAKRLELLKQIDEIKNEILQSQSVKSAVSDVVVDESIH